MRRGFAKIVLASVAAFVWTMPACAQSVTEAARTAWGFDRSDLTPHPGVRFGVLANGMRYALMPSRGGGLSVRLRIDAGSSVEGKREGGYMHLLEHLIFHGSANLPQGALSTMLPHQGLKRLSDFNAYTSLDETVYRLDLPRADPSARTTALMLMREIATNLRFGRRAVDGAKAMVLEELGTRDDLQDRTIAAQNAFFVPGTPTAGRLAAGTKASVARASGDALRRLYQRHYTPERATLVLVGAVDPAQVEVEIASRFADWRPGSDRAIDRAAPPPVLPNRRTQATVFVDPAATTVVTVAAVQPLGSPDATPRRDRLFLEHLGAEMLGRRLARAAAPPRARFVRADAAIYDHPSTARLSRIDIAARDRDWRAALQAGALALRGALEAGFSQAELDAQLAVSRRASASAAELATDAALADAIVDAVGRNLVYTAPAGPEASQAYLSRVALAELNAAFKAAWTHPSWLIFLSHDRKIANPQAIAATWTATLGSPELSPSPAATPASGRNRRETR